MSFTSGLRFRKLDLQVHTPASPCFSGDGVTPEGVVARALAKGLAGIAITDHNTGDWIDRVKQAARGTSLVVFPGIEVLVSGGRAGLHILAILDVGKGTKEISELVGALEIRTVNGQLISPHSAYDVVETITNDVHAGLAILAHCTGPKGALFEMIGLQRTNLFAHHNLLAVDVAEEDFTDPEKMTSKTRAIDLLNGDHAEFSYRRLAVIQTSDNPHPTIPGKHGLDGIGSRYTLFKLDDRISLEGLRLCLVDRDTRIRQAFEYKATVFPQICQLRVKGGFLDGMDVPLHEGLNCILGGKGAGKSLLIEFLRFVMDKQPTQREILEDHGQKLEERLQRYGEVGVTLLDDTGKELTVTRIYNPDDDNPYKEPGAEHVTRMFPALFLSQNEIIRIAENEEEQLGFIDRFFDFRSYQSKIQELEQRLGDLDREFASCLRGLRQNKAQKKEMEVYDKELLTITAQMTDPAFDEFAKADAKEKSLVRLKQFLVGIKRRLESFQQTELAELLVPPNEVSASDDPAVKRMNDLCREAKELATASLSSLRGEMERFVSGFDSEYTQWRPQFEATKRKYDEAVQTQKGDYKLLEQKRLRIAREKESLTQRLNGSQALADRTKDVKERRDGVLGQLSDTYKEYRRERLLKSQKFEADSGSKLSISINESTNVDEFHDRLKTLKKGTYLSDDEINKICRSMPSYDFILHILRYDAADRSVVYLNAIEKATGLEIKKVQKLADHLLDENQYEGLLELQYKARPQDRPEIRYRVSSTRYELLKKLSVGQKCTAMLIIALSDGTMPIVIDQPEDSLDIRSIWEDMCLKLRAGKESRQFIFTTHNSSLAVASDTDKYLVLEGDAASGKVVFSGAIDSEPVRKQVIEYLEGGLSTYRAKYLKYNIPPRKLFT